MLIRPAEPADAEAIARLTNRFIEHTTIHFAIEAMSPEDVRGEMAAASGRTPAYPWYTAELDGRFAGYAKAYTWRSRAAYARTAEVGVYVEEAARRRGVARALYRALLEELARLGYHLAVGGITLPNEASVRLHEACGFEHIGTFQECGWKFGAWRDVGFWARRLAD